MKPYSGIISLFIFFCCTSPTCFADTDWMSVTLDNDLFLGNDNGYTNGLYIASFDVGTAQADDLPKPQFWVKPLLWSMPDSHAIDGAASAYTFGQTMNTPSDIRIANPATNELPYSALLALTHHYLTVTENSADLASTTVGVVGPAALGEQSQKFVHDVIEADEPQGWDTQLGNEVVFQLTRARAQQYWQSESGRMDLVTNITGNLGTISSAVSTGAIFRFGKGLMHSYATTLFNSSRTSNPTNINKGWYFYTGLQAGYTFNNIFADGNTFRDSRSIDYDPEFISILSGISYAWGNISVTLSLNDNNILQSGSNELVLEELTQYGSISLAWRL